MARMTTNTTYQEYRRTFGVSKYPHGQPRDPEKLRLIIHYRDKNLSWRTIGPMVKMTGQGACMLYQRWYDWSCEEKYKELI